MTELVSSFHSVSSSTTTMTRAAAEEALRGAHNASISTGGSIGSVAPRRGTGASPRPTPNDTTHVTVLESIAGHTEEETSRMDTAPLSSATSLRTDSSPPPLNGVLLRDSTRASRVGLHSSIHSSIRGGGGGLMEVGERTPLSNSASMVVVGTGGSSVPLLPQIVGVGTSAKESSIAELHACVLDGTHPLQTHLCNSGAATLALQQHPAMQSLATPDRSSRPTRRPSLGTSRELLVAPAATGLVNSYGSFSISPFSSTRDISSTGLRGPIPENALATHSAQSPMTRSSCLRQSPTLVSTSRSALPMVSPCSTEMPALPALTRSAVTTSTGSLGRGNIAALAEDNTPAAAVVVVTPTSSLNEHLRGHKFHKISEAEEEEEVLREGPQGPAAAWAEKIEVTHAVSKPQLLLQPPPPPPIISVQESALRGVDQLLSTESDSDEGQTRQQTSRYTESEGGTTAVSPMVLVDAETNAFAKDATTRGANDVVVASFLHGSSGSGAEEEEKESPNGEGGATRVAGATRLNSGSLRQTGASAEGETAGRGPTAYRALSDAALAAADHKAAKRRLKKPKKVHHSARQEEDSLVKAEAAAIGGTAAGPASDTALRRRRQRKKREMRAKLHAMSSAEQRDYRAEHQRRRAAKKAQWASKVTASPAILASARVPTPAPLLQLMDEKEREEGEEGLAYAVVASSDPLYPPAHGLPVVLEDMSNTSSHLGVPRPVNPDYPVFQSTPLLLPSTGMLLHEGGAGPVASSSSSAALTFASAVNPVRRCTSASGPSVSGPPTHASPPQTGSGAPRPYRRQLLSDTTPGPAGQYRASSFMCRPRSAAEVKDVAVQQSRMQQDVPSQDDHLPKLEEEAVGEGRENSLAGEEDCVEDGQSPTAPALYGSPSIGSNSASNLLLAAAVTPHPPAAAAGSGAAAIHELKQHQQQQQQLVLYQPHPPPRTPSSHAVGERSSAAGTPCGREGRPPSAGLAVLQSSPRPPRPSPAMNEAEHEPAVDSDRYITPVADNSQKATSHTYGTQEREAMKPASQRYSTGHSAKDFSVSSSTGDHSMNHSRETSVVAAHRQQHHRQSHGKLSGANGARGASSREGKRSNSRSHHHHHQQLQQHPHSRHQSSSGHEAQRHSSHSLASSCSSLRSRSLEESAANGSFSYSYSYDRSSSSSGSGSGSSSNVGANSGRTANAAMLPLKAGCTVPPPSAAFVDLHYRYACVPQLQTYAEPAVIHEWNLTEGCWGCVETSVVLSPQPFSKGNMRASYHMIDLRRLNCMLVAKRYLKSSVGEDQYFDDVAMHSISGHWARAFNAMHPPKKVRFVPAAVLILPHRNPPLTLAMEPQLSGKFVKYNNNCGYVGRNARWTPQAFSHFTYQASQHALMVVDIQGVEDYYTDPQILSPDGEGYGRGNLGKKGIRRFLESHRCNGVCRAVGLPPLQRNAKGVVVAPLLVAAKTGGSSVLISPDALERLTTVSSTSGLKEERLPPKSYASSLRQSSGDHTPLMNVRSASRNGSLQGTSSPAPGVSLKLSPPLAMPVTGANGATGSPASPAPQTSSPSPRPSAQHSRCSSKGSGGGGSGSQGAGRAPMPPVSNAVKYVRCPRHAMMRPQSQYFTSTEAGGLMAVPAALSPASGAALLMPGGALAEAGGLAVPLLRPPAAVRCNATNGYNNHLSTSHSGGDGGVGLNALAVRPPSMDGNGVYPYPPKSRLSSLGGTSLSTPRLSGVATGYPLVSKSNSSITIVPVGQETVMNGAVAAPRRQSFHRPPVLSAVEEMETSKMRRRHRR